MAALSYGRPSPTSGSIHNFGKFQTAITLQRVIRSLHVWF